MQLFANSPLKNRYLLFHHNHDAVTQVANGDSHTGQGKIPPCFVSLSWLSSTHPSKGKLALFPGIKEHINN